MQFLAIAQPNFERFTSGLPSDFEAMVRNEQEKVRICYRGGELRQIWEKAEGRGAVALFEADDRQSLDSLLASFPLVAAGYVQFQVIALAPYSGFGDDV